LQTPVLEEQPWNSKKSIMLLPLAIDWWDILKASWCFDPSHGNI
jgi:hypothetical protein